MLNHLCIYLFHIIIHCFVQLKMPFLLFPLHYNYVRMTHQSYVILRLMYCLGTVKWRLGKSSLLIVLILMGKKDDNKIFELAQDYFIDKKKNFLVP